MIYIKDLTAFDSNSARNIFKCRNILTICASANKISVQEIASLIFKFLLAENADKIRLDAWFQLLFFEQGTNNNCLFKWLDI